MTCSECQGEVNVSMHHGATLRCGCGKTTMDNAAARVAARESLKRPVVPTQGELERLLTLMREYRALRVKSGDLEVELSPEAFAPQWPAQSSTTQMGEEKPCRCGHSIEVEHNDAGLCLQGCDPVACAEKAAA